MTTTTRSTTLVAALAAAISSASRRLHAAATAEDDTRFVAAHAVKITSTGFDFGSRNLLAGRPQRSGELAWWVDDDNAPLAALDGYLHLNDVEGACARMRLRYKTSGGALVAERFGGTVCVDDDDHHVFDVSLSPYSDRTVHEVEISLMRQFASSGWSSVAEDRPGGAVRGRREADDERLRPRQRRVRRQRPERFRHARLAVDERRDRAAPGRHPPPHGRGRRSAPACGSTTTTSTATSSAPRSAAASAPRTTAIRSGRSTSARSPTGTS